MRRLSVLVAGAVLLAFASFGSSATAARGKDVRSLPFKMTATDVPTSEFSEPSIALSSKDHVFFCGPLGFPAGNNGFIRTADWSHFERVNVKDPAGGGDCDVKVGPDDAVYTANLQVVGSAIRKSTDDGKTFGLVATEDSVEQDRQWLAPDPKDPKIVYFVYHDFAAEAEIMAKSIDGGMTFPIHTLISNDPQTAGDTYPNTFSGPVRIDPTNHDRLYVVYAISSATSNTNECQTNPTGCPFGAPETIVVARSDDAGVTWTNSVAMTSPPGSILGNLFPWIAIDKKGDVFVVAAGHIPGRGNKQINGVYMASSTDHGTTWTEPEKINKSENAVVFPTIVAGAKGIVDIAWLEADSAKQESDKNVWSVHFAQSRNALSGIPKFTQVDGPVIRHGLVCTAGVNCSGGRDLGDFMEIALDSFGYAHVAVPSTEGAARHVLYWRQDAGPSAYSEPGQGGKVVARPGPR